MFPIQQSSLRLLRPSSRAPQHAALALLVLCDVPLHRRHAAGALVDLGRLALVQPACHVSACAAGVAAATGAQLQRRVALDAVLLADGCSGVSCSGSGSEGVRRRRRPTIVAGCSAVHQAAVDAAALLERQLFEDWRQLLANRAPGRMATSVSDGTAGIRWPLPPSLLCWGSRTTL